MKNNHGVISWKVQQGALECQAHHSLERTLHIVNLYNKLSTCYSTKQYCKNTYMYHFSVDTRIM